MYPILSLRLQGKLMKEVVKLKHIRTLGKTKLPVIAASGGLKGLKEDKKPPVNVTMTL